MLRKLVVKVFSSQVCVAICGQNLEVPIIDPQNRNIECASSQVEHQDGLLLIIVFNLIQAIGDGCGCGLVEDALDSQSAAAKG